MKKGFWIQALCFTLSLSLGLAASAQTASHPQTLRGVICEKNSSGQVRECSQAEMLQMIRSLKVAKEAGEKEKASLGAKAHQVSKGVLVVGGVWFSTSLLMAYLDAEFDMMATEALASALGTIIHVNVMGGWQIPTRIAEGYMFRGLLIGGAATLVGGILTFLTPSKAANGTLTDYYAHDENFGKLMNLSDDYILALAQSDSNLGNKIVSVFNIAIHAPVQ